MISMLAELPPIAINLMVVGFFLVCLIMILTVLIQKPQGGGLSGAFGSGAGSGQTAFGARTGDALTVATIGIFVFYIIAAVGLNFAVKPTIAAPPGVSATSTEAPADSTGTSTDTATPPAANTPSATPPTTPPSTPATTPAPEAAPAPDAPAVPAGGAGTEPETTPPPTAEPETPPADSPATPG